MTGGDLPNTRGFQNYNSDCSYEHICNNLGLSGVQNAGYF